MTPDKTELEKKLDLLRTQIGKGKAVELLETNEGWVVVKEQIQIMVDALSADILSTKYITDHDGYISQLGAYNALKSLLDSLTSIKDTGISAQSVQTQLKADNAEEIQRLGSI